ncbi:hypothetical protein [Metabacillus sp. RGM 3146]|uniref:hypothetical protein n=1 Tax=Metabacillus sp. RGM 3146 TaxID=3401092 RepID=UPI003B9A69A2
MKINFTKKQYHTLLKMIYLSTWVGAREEHEESEEFFELENYILSFSKEFGMEQYADYDSLDDEYYASRQLDEELEDVIADYEEEVFWDKLCALLARRDLMREENISNYSPEQRFERLIEIENKYHTYFEVFGLEKVKTE